MVGDILRRERERQNLSIKDIEKATSIRALYIEAIEKSENDKLPGEVYTKGFIKNYANFLKLDSESLVRQYRDEVSPVPTVSRSGDSTGEAQSSESQSSEQTSTDAPKPEKEPELVTKNVSRSERSASTGEGGNRTSMLAVAAVLALAIIGGLFYYFNSVEGGELASKPVEPAQKIEQATTETASESEKPATTNVASAAASTDGVNLEAKFSANCWTRVEVDGILAYEGTAEPGQSLSWKANDRISVTAGNAGAIEFVENGVNLGVAGAVGDVIEKTFVKK